MSESKRSNLKSFVRVTILSAVLAFLIIYLGIYYHWGGYLKSEPIPSAELLIPEKINSNETIDQVSTTTITFTPKIVDSKKTNAFLDSMNKDSIAEHCVNLLSKDISDEATLELVTVNCVISNYQETFQYSQSFEDESKNQLKYKRQCIKEHSEINQLSLIDKELLIGICVSDRMNISN